MNATNAYISLRDAFAKTIRAAVKTTRNAMATARTIMESKDSAEAAAEAMNMLRDEYDALPKDKREESGLLAAIRSVYKDTSTAVALDRASLKKAGHDASAIAEKLHARYPYRVTCIKGAYIAMTHAEFDAAKPAGAKNNATDGDGGDGDGDETGSAPNKGIDKAAVALEALRAQVYALQIELAQMTADRDAWADRATVAEAALGDLNKPAAAKPAKPAKAAKPAKPAKPAKAAKAA